MGQNYRQIQIWQRSHQFTLKVYHLTHQFPDSERFGLTSQIRHSAVSVPSNIVEGSARESDGDFARFITIAMASAAELDYQLLLAHDLQYIPSNIYKSLENELNQIRRMMYSFRATLKT
jgi:four helix bundle protein